MDPLHNHADVDLGSDFAAAACRRVFDAQDQGVLVAGTDGRVLNASAPLEALFGYVRGTLNGRRTASLLPKRLRRTLLELDPRPTGPRTDWTWEANEGLVGVRRDGKRVSHLCCRCALASRRHGAGVCDRS